MVPSILTGVFHQEAPDDYPAKPGRGQWFVFTFGFGHGDFVVVGFMVLTFVILGWHYGAGMASSWGLFGLGYSRSCNHSRLCVIVLFPKFLGVLS
jgi:hypothetical protein